MLTDSKQALSGFEGLGAKELAFLGDCVFELMVREKLVCEGPQTVGSLHKKSTEMVRASTQAGFAAKLLPHLTKSETGVYLRGRNAYSKRTPNGCTPQEYRMATGFEALFGYLFLKNETNRIRELFKIIL